MCAGLVIAAFCGAAYRSEVEQEVMEAYYRGVRDEQASREINLTDPKETI